MGADRRGSIHRSFAQGRPATRGGSSSGRAGTRGRVRVLPDGRDLERSLWSVDLGKGGTSSRSGGSSTGSAVTGRTSIGYCGFERESGGGTEGVGAGGRARIDGATGSRCPPCGSGVRGRSCVCLHV